MTEKESFTEQTLKRIRSGETGTGKRGTRKLSRLILIIDALFVILVLLFIYSRNDAPHYFSSSVSVGDLNARFSVNNDKKAKAYLFSLTLASTSEKKKIYLFRDSVATLKLFSSGDPIFEDAFSKNTGKLTILPGEVRTFVVSVNHIVIDTSMQKIPEYGHRKKRTLFDFSGKDKMITATAQLNLSERISTSLEFEYEAR